jgi:hypothetical protein
MEDGKANAHAIEPRRQLMVAPFKDEAGAAPSDPQRVLVSDGAGHLPAYSSSAASSGEQAEKRRTHDDERRRLRHELDLNDAKRQTPRTRVLTITRV